MIYKIHQGAHVCNRRFPIPILWASEIHYAVCFDQSAKYESWIKANQADVNKLTGFTEGFFPHKNSARIGWNYDPVDDVINLFAYCYNRGVRTIKQICTVDIGERFEVRIQALPGRWIFYVFTDRAEEGVAIEEIQRAKRGKIFGFRLFPYFGGDESAPHEITIDLQKL
jgi:hypothetical protein